MPDSCCCIQKKATLNWVALAFICGGVIRSITRKISLLDARYSPPPLGLLDLALAAEILDVSL